MEGAAENSAWLECLSLLFHFSYAIKILLNPIIQNNFILSIDILLIFLLFLC